MDNTRNPYAAPKEAGQIRHVEITWKGHVIQFIPVVSWRTLWCYTLNELRIDGEIAATSGGMRLWERAKAKILHQGDLIQIVVESSTCFTTAFGLNYSMKIDGEIVSEGIAIAQFR